MIKSLLLDLMALVGLLMMGYGLHLFRPWLAFFVVGLIVFVLALARALRMTDVSDGA